MKTVLFVPGFQEDLKDRDYTSVLRAIESKGYKVQFVHIQWKRTTIDGWVKELESVYKDYGTKETILAGFSYGAMTALVTASNRNPAELWLFSLSPYFTEDISLLKLAWLRNIGKQRTEKFWRTSFNELYPKIDCPVKLFIGEKEIQKWPIMKHRFKDSAGKFKNCTPFEIPNVGHEVDHQYYIRGIVKNI